MTTMLTYTILGLLAAAVWHLIYETIILPSLRLELRFKLFGLRDRLRRFKAEHSKQCPDTAFELLDDSVSWHTQNIHRLTFGMAFAANQKMKADPKFREHVEKQLKALDNCQLPEFVELRKLRGELLVLTFAANSGGWLIYVFPIVYVWATWQQVMARSRQLVGMRSAQLESVAECYA